MRRDPFCWQSGTATRAAPTVAILDSTDLFGDPPLTLPTKQPAEVVRNHQTLLTSIQTCLPCPIFSQPVGTRHDPCQHTEHRVKARGGAPAQQVPAEMCWGGAMATAKPSEIPSPFCFGAQMENSIKSGSTA